MKGEKKERQVAVEEDRAGDQKREEHDENPHHEHKSDESWSTPRWGPLLDEHDTGVDK